MKTLEEVFDEIGQNEELKSKFMSEQTAEKWVALVKGLGVDTTAEELAPYLSEWGNREGILPDKSLEQVTGGNIPVPEQADEYEHGIHPKCGGHIANHYIPFVSCRCEKCGEKHYFYDQFFKMIETNPIIV